MAIELTCPTCQQMLRVGDEQAGRQARCPKCSTVFQVPAPASTPPATLATPGAASGKKWYVKAAGGKQYGPVEKSVLDQWANERRITSDCQLLEEGSSQWGWASDVYPSLTGHGQFKEPAYAAGGGQPNPYHSPSADFASRGSGYTMPHRGAIVLTLGILGVLICGILGIPAWVMGSSDLNDMKAGRMDPSGYGMTQAGMILGIVSCCLLGLGCCMFFVAAAAG